MGPHCSLLTPSSGQSGHQAPAGIYRGSVEAKGHSGSVLKICFPAPGPLGRRAWSQACLIHSGDWMLSSGPAPSLFSPPPQGHAPSSLTPADCSPLPRARPLFPSPTWLYLVDQLEEAKWGQLLLAWPGHYLKKGGSKWRGILPTGPPPCMSHRCGLSAPLPSTCWLMGSMALAGENC